MKDVGDGCCKGGVVVHVGWCHWLLAMDSWDGFGGQGEEWWVFHSFPYFGGFSTCLDLH